MSIFFVCSIQPIIAQVSDSTTIISVDLFEIDIGGTSINAIINEEKAWLSVAEVFTFLKINFNLSNTGDTLSGFFLTTENKYSLNAAKKSFTINRKSSPIATGALLKNDTALYLRADLFKVFFKLDCKFDFRSLSVILSTSLDLPIVRENKQALLRNNIGRLTNDIKADTVIGLQYKAFDLAAADWSLNSANTFKGESNTRVNLALGGVILGGETVVSLQYNNKSTFLSDQQFYLWKRVNNHNNFLSQISIGKIYINPTASIFASVVGVQLSNSPTVFRRSFGSYRLSRNTQPGWIVELYVNGILIAYTKADASGNYTFDVPLVYGNTLIQVRYYGPNGEQKMGEANISMPFTFLPVGKLEYNLSAGMVEDSAWSRYSKLQLNYGLLKRLTIGSGVEYLSSIEDRKAMPFLYASFRISRNMLFSTDYVHGVKSNFTGNFRLPSNLQVELNYIKYVEGQKAIYNTYLEERRLAVSIPLRYKKLNVYSRLSYYQIVLASSKYTTIEAMVSGVISGISSNLTTYALYTDNNKPYVYSNLSFAVRLPFKTLFLPQVQFEYNDKRFISMKTEIEKRISKTGFVNFYYESNFKSSFNSINFGIRFDMAHTQADISVRNSTGADPTLISSVRGTLLYDASTGYNRFTKYQGVGRGGLIVSAFLDLNNNGKRDQGEPKVNDLKFTFGGGFTEPFPKDSSIVVRNLEAYNSFILSIDVNSFEEIAWRIKTATIKIEISPNQFKILEIPITVLGEVSGTVFIQKDTTLQSQKQILINIYNKDGVIVAQTISEQDGYFSYLGLAPGDYSIKPDPAQAKKLGLTFSSTNSRVKIKATLKGDIISGIDFIGKK
jgi:hypothetical protein